MFFPVTIDSMEFEGQYVQFILAIINA